MRNHPIESGVTTPPRTMRVAVKLAAPLSRCCDRTGGFASPPHDGFALADTINVDFAVALNVSAPTNKSPKGDCEANSLVFMRNRGDG
jgi:hypothetical protein